MFTNREEAAFALSDKLSHLKDQQTLVLGIPRGGVIMAKIIASALNAPYDVIMCKKIPHPQNAELAVGAVSLYTEISSGNLHIPEKYFNDKASETRKQLLERYKKYTGRRKTFPIGGKTIILVDDGIATGLTMLASIQLVIKHKPKAVVVASPVISRKATDLIKNEADELLVLQSPENLSAIGECYNHFQQIADEEVIATLNS